MRSPSERILPPSDENHRTLRGIPLRGPTSPLKLQDTHSIPLWMRRERAGLPVGAPRAAIDIVNITDDAARLAMVVQQRIKEPGGFQVAFTSSVAQYESKLAMLNKRLQQRMEQTLRRIHVSNDDLSQDYEGTPWNTMNSPASPYEAMSSPTSPYGGMPGDRPLV